MRKSLRLLAQARALRLIPQKLVDTLLAGNYRSIFKGIGIEFNQNREYIEGDDARLIDWNVSSRIGSVYTKVFSEEHDISLMLIIDNSASIRANGLSDSLLELQRSIATLLILSAAQNDYNTGIIFFSDAVEKWIPPRKGRYRTLSLLQHLNDLKITGSGSNLSSAIQMLIEASKRRGICIIISDFRTTNYQKNLAQLAKRHEVIAILIYQDLSALFSLKGTVQLQDPEMGSTIIARGASRSFRNRYTQYWEKWRAEWKQYCDRVGVSTLEISIDDNPIARLIKFFRNKQR